MKNSDIKQLKNLLDSSQKAVIVTHHNPDGDAIGSVLALYHYLVKKGLQTQIFIPNMYPDFLEWMHRGENLKVYNEKDKETIANVFSDSDLIFCLDFNVPKRSHFLEQFIVNSSAYKILIDHHIEPDIKSFNLIFSKIETSSTAELIFDIIDACGDKNLIDKTMAECLYVGMATDTGSFSYNNNYVHTYEILTHLFSLGIDGAKIQRLVYNNFTENRMRLFGLCLNEKLHVLKDYKTAYIVLSLNDLKKYSYNSGDTEGIVNYALSIKGIDMAALFIERKELIRISFRSYEDLSVNKIASDFFEGGGHKNAAGANSYESLEATVDKFLKILPDLDKYRL
ncbi:MAG: bifunctional oligoribonuclease/PAP phosphatase NrnA [Bacteroidales bacterium]|nr:bifunctional oligoribonuclease/PAP phosphatase NrnA [Bacteroidales bacterium]